ncbi:MAG: peptidoglycan DD-metalloendopeptidase family protein [Melioribacteraceae bacterium]|nr:peptidoglycan DD-metalloendopeptidase family protein [Melioribacteraceae bacterium]MCF8394398.1 peptidoglycan DD-metalloendopeptidase family protein [Melioribacteraceae bacterium]MCF8417506.1 peptidoglycan DD-metalloendopeptidase family protein [Melioribacteraceae bacterium]
MKLAKLSLLIMFIFSSTQFAQFNKSEVESGEMIKQSNTPCLTEEQRREIHESNNKTITRLIKEGKINPSSFNSPKAGSFSWPLKASADVDDLSYCAVSNFVDHNSSYPDQLLDYNGGTRTYDTDAGYNHQGTDISPWPFPWYKMDHDQIEVIAVMDGMIIGKEDGHYDRNCSMSDSVWNAVYVLHDNGAEVWYGHLKENSLTTKLIGERVSAGEYLGIVGSSGSSTGPHLHLEVYDSTDVLIDPWSGLSNPTITESWWIDQPLYYDSKVNKLATHSAWPEFPACPQQEIPHFSDEFDPGDSLYLASYYQDLMAGQLNEFSVVDPNGATVSSWNYSISEQHLSAAFLQFSIGLPSDYRPGTWQVRLTYEGTTYTHDFTEIEPVPVELVSFTGTVNDFQVLLKWQTATEINNYGFFIERKSVPIKNKFSSNDEKIFEWEEIGFVEGHGNSNSYKEYSFTDYPEISGAYLYRLKQTDLDGKFEYSEEIIVETWEIFSLADGYKLEQNFPNPFNPTTKIIYQIPNNGKVVIKLYDILGSVIQTLVDENMSKGRYVVPFDGSNFPSGVYIYRITSGEFTASKKLVLLK